MNNIQRQHVFIVTCLIILTLGLVTASLGPLLPDIAKNNQTSVLAAGSILTALFLGGLLAQVAVGPVSDRIGQTQIMVFATLLVGAAAIGLSFSRSLPLTLSIAFLGGIGHGSLILCCNVLVARVYPERSAYALSLSNLFYGVGAFLGPALIGFFLSQVNSGLPVFWVMGLLMLVESLLIFRVRAFEKLIPKPEEKSGPVAAPIYRSPLLWSLGILALLYAGMENGLGSWITAYFDQTTQLTYETATLVASGFWISLTLGRLASAFLSRWLNSRQVLGLTLVGSLAGLILLGSTRGNSAASMLSVFICGFFFGAVFPSIISITTTRFAHGPARAVSVVTAVSNLGGMTLPWLQGWLLEEVSPMAFSLGLAGIGAGALAIYVWVMARYFRPHTVEARAGAKSSR